jgi:ABC transporter substrate binding protein
MRSKSVLTILLLALIAPISGEAQSIGTVYRVGLLLTTTPSDAAHLIKALTEGLRELGYVEGRNVVFERRFAEGRQERLPALAAELVQLKVDILVTGSNPVIAAVKQATATIPVVMAVSRDPVGAGFIASLARPGGNITGLANDAAPEIIGKNLELLKEAVPRVSRVAFLWNPVPPGAHTAKSVVERAYFDLDRGLWIPRAYFDEMDAREWRWREVEGPEGFADYARVVQASRFLALRKEDTHASSRGPGDRTHRGATGVRRLHQAADGADPR